MEKKNIPSITYQEAAQLDQAAVEQAFDFLFDLFLQSTFENTT